MLNGFLDAFLISLSPECIIANIIGVALGIIFGALPGLTSVMGLALLIPLTFGMGYMEAFSALLGMYCGSIYGGSITAILVGTPGTVAAAATMLEGPALTAKGESKKALDIATIASFVGGILSCFVLMTIAPMLAKIALLFGPAEYFAVALFGMSVVAVLSAKSFIKGALSALIGLYISTIGIDPVSGELRNTFNNINFYSGLTLIPILIGLFAVGQIFITLENFFKNQQEKINVKISNDSISFVEVWKNKFNMIRSSIIGIAIGIIPAVGSGTASYISYSTAQKKSKNPEEYGKGSLEGLVSTESANNAVTGGALVPLLSLGVPGDAATAVILGALMVQGIVPGPLLFTESPDVVNGIFSTLIVSNILMFVIGMLSIRPLSKILLIPTNILMPAVLTLCAVGAYATNNSVFDLYVMIFFGVLGYLMTKIEMPTSPLLLSLMLSPIVEVNFRRALIVSNNDYSVFITRPICLGILIVTSIVIVRTILSQRK